VHEMLVDRKYAEVVSGTWAKNMDEFLDRFVKFGTVDKDAMSFVRMNSTRHSTPVFVYVLFSTDMSIGIKSLGKITEKVTASKMTHCILIYPGNITSSARKCVEKSSKIKIEAFSEEELSINITKHRLMPEHYVLTSREKAKFLNQSKITESQLPRILWSDPVARYYGMRRGDLIRVIRKSDTAGRYMMYRICN
jgi:DNA-directed RNA polymerase I, II, and III subunit RPABC1